MRPEPQPSQQAAIYVHETALQATDRSGAQALVALTDEQREMLVVLQTERNGMTVRQLQARLPHSGDGSAGAVESLLQGLVERQLVARLNTVVPSYIHRYEGLDLDPR